MHTRSLAAVAVLCLFVLSGSPIAVPAEYEGASAPAGDQAPATPPPPAGGRGGSPFTPPEPLDLADRTGWTSIFDGRTLTGWSGNPDVWSVANGAIAATSTSERRVGSTHIIWTGGEPADFELKLAMKLEGDIHSGIAYRSFVDPARAAGGAGRGGGGGRAGGAGPQVPANPKWTLYGPGLDFDYDRKMAGNLEDRGTPRRQVSWRGGVVRTQAGQRPRLIATIGDADVLLAAIRQDDWNQVHIIARGNQLTHIINGQLMTVMFDEDPAYFRPAGSIGLQIETFGLGTVNFRDIWIRQDGQ